ncbi:MAG: metallophosphoesterase [Gemmatimonadota bacterium]
MPDATPSRRSFLRPFLTVVGVWSVLWGLPTILLLYRIVPGGLPTAIGAWMVVVCAPLVGLLRAFGGAGAPSARTRVWIFRPFWYLQLLMPVVAIGGVIGALVGWPLGSAGWAGRIGLAVTAGMLVLLVLLGYLGSRRLVVRTLPIAIAGLADDLIGLRIAQVSDLHVGPHTRTAFLARVVARIQESAPDLIVFTGDQVDDFVADVAPFAAAFGDLHAPLGLYAVAGNHDVYAGWSGVRAGLERMGIDVLVNEAVPIERGHARLWLAGTGDPAGRSGGFRGADAPAPDLDRTTAGIPAGEPVVALAHNPALWPGLAQRGVHLTLSGHTHYGQLAFPKRDWSLAGVFLEHGHGLHRDGDRVLYINPGTNYWGIPFRLGTPAEVTVLILERA